MAHFFTAGVQASAARRGTEFRGYRGRRPIAREAKVEFRYLGFDQHENARAYRFDSVATGRPTRYFTVSADMGLFLAHRVGIQEGPNLCVHKLASDLEMNSEARHELTGDDLRAHLAAVALTAAQKTGTRKTRRSLETMA
jgi:hypothetical protein